MQIQDQQPKFEFEMKLVLPQSRVAPVKAFLRALCREDRAFPANTVASIYFDTRHLEFLHAKLNSDLLKTKVRVRWYEDSQSRQPVGAAFAELKYRRGLCRSKIRVQTPYSAEEIAKLSLRDPSLVQILDLLQSRESRDLSLLDALLEVRYERLRFFEPISGSRISLDSQIGLGRVQTDLLPHTNRRKLGQAVIEVKNRSGRIPALLNPLFRIGARKDSFSKYLGCFRLATVGISAAV